MEGMKKSLTRRELAQAQNFWAASFGKPTTEVQPKRELKHSDEPTEHQHQVKVISWWNRHHEAFGLPVFALFHVPNGGSRHMLEAVKLKAAGVRPGIPDLFLDVPRNGYHGLRIEMKKESLRNRKNGGASDEQMAVHQFLKDQGYSVVMAWSADDVIAALKEYLANVKTNVAEP